MQNDINNTNDNNCLKVEVENEIKVKSSIWYKDLRFLIPIIVSLGALVISIYPEIKSSKPLIKVKSFIQSGDYTYKFTGFDYKEKEIKGMAYTLNLSFSRLKKSFYFKDFNVKIKFEGETHPINGIVIPLGSKIFVFDSIGSNNEPAYFEYTVPKEKELVYESVLLKDALNNYFLCFMIEYSDLIDIGGNLKAEYILLEFINFKDKHFYTSKIDLLNLDAKKLQMDSEYFKLSE